MPLRKQKRTLFQFVRRKHSGQDLYSHIRVMIDMTLYRNTQPAHTTALIQGTYYQHEPATSFNIIAHGTRSIETIKEPSNYQSNTMENTILWEKRAISLLCCFGTFGYFASFPMKSRETILNRLSCDSSPVIVKVS